MKRRVVAWGLTGLLAWTASARGDVFGTLSNFDVYNETGEDAYGCELELEGVHRSDVMATFPAHFSNESIVEYQEGATFGVRIKYTGYNFNPSGKLASTVGMSTNGHFCVNTAGCEHFGFSLAGAQPTATRYFWLNQQEQRIGMMPMSIPTPNWNYVPPAQAGDRPRLEAEVEPPEEENEIQRPDSIWMKVYKTEIERPVDLLELMSDNAMIPDDLGETESEWELLEGGKMKVFDDDVADGSKSVLRRFEFFEYTGAYDDEHEPLSEFLDSELPEPPVGELGQFIAANMVAANLEAPAVVLQGDFNGDGSVDGADVIAWQQQVGRDDHPHADLDHDGEVGDDDLRAWRHGFRLHNFEDDNPQLAGVPEPSTTVLAASGVWAGAAIRRRFRKRTAAD